MRFVLAILLLGVGIQGAPTEDSTAESVNDIPRESKKIEDTYESASDDADGLIKLAKEIDGTYTPGPTGDSPASDHDEYLDQEHHYPEEEDYPQREPQPYQPLQNYLPFGMPAFPSWFSFPWFGQPPGYPLQYPQQRMMGAPDGRYLKKMDSSRRRRSLPYADPQLVKTVVVPNEDTWWDDVNFGMEAEVQEMAEKNAGYATYAAISNRLDHYAPPIHIGSIDTGEFRNPFLEDPRYRSFGIGSDFNAEDMDAFRFTPQGEHLALDMDQLEELISSGYLPLGKRFNIDYHLITGYSNCWFGKHLKNMLPLGIVDAFSSEARKSYWVNSNCASFRQGTYELLGIKKSYEKGHKGYNNWVIFLKGQAGVVAVDNFNPAGLQGASPFLQRTAQHQLTQTHRNKIRKIVGTSEKYMFTQPGISHVTGSQYNPSGTRLGLQQDQYKAAYQDGMYDNSVLWSTTTGKNYDPYSRDYSKYGLNLDIVHQPYHPHFHYSHPAPEGHYSPLIYVRPPTPPTSPP